MAQPEPAPPGRLRPVVAKPPGSRPRRFFIRGLAVLLPSILTLWILWYAFFFVFDNVAAPINRWIRAGVIQAIPRTLSEPYRPQWYRVTPEQVRAFRRDNPAAASLEAFPDGAVVDALRAQNFALYWQARWHLQAVGLLVAIVVIYVAGGIVGGFVGRRVYGRVERVIARIPVFRQIYPHVKQVVDLILGDSAMAFKRVVLVEFPRKGMWVLGFVTGEAPGAIARCLGSPSLTLFIPNTPTPFTGFTVTVPADEVMDTALSVDEAVRYLITGGVLVPEEKGLIEGRGRTGGTASFPGAPGGAAAAPPPAPL